MKAGLDIKISNYTLYGLLAAVIIVLAMFFFVGFGEKVAVVAMPGKLEGKVQKGDFASAPVWSAPADSSVVKPRMEARDALLEETKKADPKSVDVETLTAEVMKENFGVAFDINPDKTPKLLRSPEHADTLIYLMYILTIVPVVLICGYMLVRYVMNLVEKPAETLKGSIGVAMFVLLIVVAWVLAKTDINNTPECEQALLINGEAWKDYGSMVLTDSFLYIQYVLLVLCIVLTVVSLTGVVKYINKVKES